MIGWRYMHAYIWYNGRFWITCAEQRRDPRCSDVVSGRIATAKGRAIIYEDNQELKD